MESSRKGIRMKNVKGEHVQQQAHQDIEEDARMLSTRTTLQQPPSCCLSSKWSHLHDHALTTTLPTEVFRTDFYFFEKSDASSLLSAHEPIVSDCAGGGITMVLDRSNRKRGWQQEQETIMLRREQVDAPGEETLLENQDGAFKKIRKEQNQKLNVESDGCHFATRDWLFRAFAENSIGALPNRNQGSSPPDRALLLQIEPRPIGTLMDLSIVDRTPAIDPAWIEDEDLFRCIQPLIARTQRNHRKGERSPIDAGPPQVAPTKPSARLTASASPTNQSGGARCPTIDAGSPPVAPTRPSPIHLTASTSPAKGNQTSFGGSVGKLLMNSADTESLEDPNIKAHHLKQWNERYTELVKFHQEFGHVVVPYHYTKNIPLALWVKRQRHQYKLKNEGLHSTMTNERQKALEDLGFVWDSHKATWEEHLNELISFRDKEGHCNVPATYDDSPQLAIWVKCQRRQYKLFRSGHKSNITEERIARLKKIGFSWGPRLQQRQASNARNSFSV